MRGAISIPQTLQVLSPTSSISSILQSGYSSFVGRSPAPIFQNDSTGYIGLNPVELRYRGTHEANLRHVLSEIETLYGTDHCEYRHKLKNLGALMIDQGRYKSAEETSRRLISITPNVHSKNRNDMYDALDLLGKALLHQGLFSQSEKLFRQTFTARRKAQGSEHPDTLISQGNLASTYREEGRYIEAN